MVVVERRGPHWGFAAQGLEVNDVFRNDNSYGDARRLPGEVNCYQAKQSTFCMQPMRATSSSKP